MKKDIKVSVILPVYNAELFVKQAIQSVLDQTFKNFELIIIDDCSTDASFRIIQQFEDPRIRIFNHGSNMGDSASRKQGINEARGIWIAPLDADDVWAKDHLQKKITISDKYPCSFIGSDVMISFSDRENNLVPYKSVLEDRKLKFDYLYWPELHEIVKYGLAFPPMFPKEPLISHKIEFRRESKGHFWLYLYIMLYRIGLKHVIVNEPLYFYRYRLNSNSLSAAYSSDCFRIFSLKFLENLDGLDLTTKHQLKLAKKRLGYKLVVSSLRNGLWKKASMHIISSPMSIFFVIKSYLSWLSRRKKFKNLVDSK